ncbi:universal stress protein family protein [Hordeum vulgare]|nr:universal stress protein family protein [Hordeum vulgare]
MPRRSPVGRKRVMVVVDQSYGAKHAMMWALTHVANRGHFLTLLHVLLHGSGARGEDASVLANSLGSLCKACKPEVVPLLPSLLQEEDYTVADIILDNAIGRHKLQIMACHASQSHGADHQAPYPLVHFYEVLILQFLPDKELGEAPYEELGEAPNEEIGEALQPRC